MIEYKEIDIEKIKSVENIRTTHEKIAELMTSIKQDGLLEPIGVRKVGREYLLSYGSRRLEACKKLGWNKIAALVSDEDLTEEDFLIRNTVENLQRVDNSPIELGRVVSRLKELGLNIDEICARLAINKNRISVSIGLFNALPDKYRDVIGYKDSKATSNVSKISVSISHAITQSGLVEPVKEKLFDIAKKNMLSHAQIELIVRLIKYGSTFEDAVKTVDKYRVANFSLVVNKNVEHEFEKEVQRSLNSITLMKMLSGELPMRKNLFFSIKDFGGNIKFG